MLVWLTLLACNGKATDTAAVEPLVLPADPSASGAPVGVQTHTHQGVTFEVWYPTTDAQAGSATEPADFGQFLPASFTERVGAITLPSPDSGAIRDAPIRDTGAALPVVLFSHGFGGFRLQSFDITVHLASRGYIVVAPDHPGRMMTDLLPCLFSPPLDGCDLTGFVDDPALEGLPAALDWIAGSDLAGYADAEQLGLIGHSAGGGSVSTLAGTEPRTAAVIPMAGGGAITADVPALFIDGECDGIVSPGSTAAAAAGSADATHARLLGAGHLAFSDMCALDLGALADEHLDGRDDLNSTFYSQLLSLGIDGCSGAVPAESTGCTGDFLGIEAGLTLTRALATEFFDLHLRGEGEGVTTTDAALELTP